MAGTGERRDAGQTRRARRHPARRFGICLIGLAAGCTLPAWGGLLTTERTVADFSFAGDQVDYAPAPKTLALAADGGFAFTATAPSADPRLADRTQDPLRGSLHLMIKGRDYGDFPRADFNLFGSLPTLTRLTATRLLADSLRALRPDSKAGALEFLNDRDRMVGPLIGRYRALGIFTLVVGIEDLEWVEGFAEGAATLQLPAAEDPTANPPGPKEHH